MATATLPDAKTDRSTVEEPLHEVVHGVRVELPETAARSNIVKSDLHADLSVFVRKHGLGRAACETLFILDDAGDEQRRPDVAFVSQERWPLDREIPLEGDWQVVPELAVEVASTHDRLSEVMGKIADYFAFGVTQVWLVIPEEQVVYVYDSPKNVRILTAAESLENASLLPGFSLPLAQLFQINAASAAGRTK